MYDYSDSQCAFLIMRNTTCLKILVKLQHADRSNSPYQNRPRRQAQTVYPSASHSLASPEQRGFIIQGILCWPSAVYLPTDF